MSHSYVSNLMHCTFATKERFPILKSELESRLWPYIGGIARENKMKPLSKLLDTVAVVNEWLTESQSFQPSVPRTVDFTFKSHHSKC